MLNGKSKMKCRYGEKQTMIQTNLQESVQENEESTERSKRKHADAIQQRRSFSTTFLLRFPKMLLPKQVSILRH